MPSYSEAPEFYVDWGASEAFSLAGLGPGECGAGVRDLIEADIEDAGRYHYRAGRSLREDRPGDPAADLYRALNLTARALLVTRGVQPEADAEAFGLFQERFVDAGLVPGRYRNIVDAARRVSTGDLSGDVALDYVGALIDRVRALYDSMDLSLQFHAADAADAEMEDGPTADAIEEMDLRGVQCPFNYVQAKLRLETMSVGQILRLLLDDGEPIRNVPRSLENDGQDVRQIRRTDGYHEVVVTKQM